jgi:hypothetical protein
MHGARERFHVDRAARYLRIGDTERAARHIHRARELGFGFGDERDDDDRPGRVLAAVPADYPEPRTVPEAEREHPSLERRSYGDRARERDYGEDAPGRVLAASFGPPRGSQRRKIERWDNGRDDDETREALQAREAREAYDLEAAEDAQDELDAAEQDPSIVDLTATYDVPQFLLLFASRIDLPSRVITNLARSLKASANGADRLDGRRLWRLMASAAALRDDLVRRGVPDIAPNQHASDLARELAAFPKEPIPTVQALYEYFDLPYVP